MSKCFKVHATESRYLLHLQIGSGRKAIKMILRKREVLRRAANHKTGISQKKFAVQFGCSQSYICRTIRRLKIMCRKQVKVPKYKDIAAIL